MIKVLKDLNRLDFNNAMHCLLYKFKKALKIDLTKNEKYLSIYYNYLVKYNGILLEENDKYYITNFKRLSSVLKLRKKPSSDFDVFHQVMEEQEYLPVVNLYKEYFHDAQGYDLNIIDLGSNIGLTSVFFTEHFQRGRIVLVEPNLENFEVLSFNLKEKENFEFFKIMGAVWSSNSKVKIVSDFRDKADWAFRVEESNDLNSIQAYTINDLATKNNFEHIDILKIDIEGAEKQIFNTLVSDLEFLKKTKCIAIEIHDEFDCRKEICKILDDYGFEIINEGELTIGINTYLVNKKS
ncbi:FkbM family methyltransferase [Flavobacterium sharifuzzamanii]|uniref:FkbM family methyltransferase n=1 Tax=Flavobacterium sharifuzzamanii TaxID=2211133 RepID=UPI0013007542|nr:FkbM family methyltransferase [Flavobacterium sharifuzzamanii]KAF2081180.1 FkbM family methyltransferase [Flavobacterium sharifuzzamanii]